MRRLVTSALSVLFACALAACGGGTSYLGNNPNAVPSASPASPLPQPNQNIASSPISHVIVVVMENRTPDNLFCTAYPAVLAPSQAGQPFPGMQLQCPGATNAASWTSLASPLDPNHSYPNLVAEWDNGKMDGFAADPVTVFGSTAKPAPIPGFTNTYVPPNETPVYQLLAATYASAAYMFSGAVGAISHLRFGASFANVVSPPDQIDAALQNCRLPSIAFVTPPAFASDHSASLSAGGPGFVGDIYTNLVQTLLNTSGSCLYYNNTAIILTWDDSGGWYDHVLPPVDAQTDRSYGFRVPLVVISPYANHPASAPIFVSQQNYFTFGSILKYIENTFGLGSLGVQDAEATDLNTGNLQTSLFNYAQTPIKPLAGLLLQTLQRGVTAARATQHTPAGTPVDSDN